jgi:hypothetical protein
VRKILRSPHADAALPDAGLAWLRPTGTRTIRSAVLAGRLLLVERLVRRVTGIGLGEQRRAYLTYLSTFCRSQPSTCSISRPGGSSLAFAAPRPTVCSRTLATPSRASWRPISR